MAAAAKRIARLPEWCRSLEEQSYKVEYSQELRELARRTQASFKEPC